MKAELIVAIVTLVTALPPTLFVMHKWYTRQRQNSILTSAFPLHGMQPLRRQSHLVCSVSEQGITFGLRVDDEMAVRRTYPLHEPLDFS
ncbi:hypothetical protein DER45DRAFT_312393 [Fusarium avenaceum]|nr:hypothetical protein DER45DRAFT_312393 [Fusarium avenaceum]